MVFAHTIGKTPRMVTFWPLKFVGQNVGDVGFVEGCEGGFSGKGMEWPKADAF